MIQGTFKRENDGRLVSFELKGHANAGPHGQDIVCASVSSLSINAVNSIEALAGFTPIVETDNENDGYLYVETTEDITQEQLNIAQILLESLLLGLQDIEEEYSEFLEVKTITK